MSIYVLKVEEAESSAQNLEDTGDFASRLAAISSGRGGTSLGEIGSDLEKTGSVQEENQKSSNQCVEPPGEPSITDEKKSMEQDGRWSQINETGQGQKIEAGETSKEAEKEGKGATDQKYNINDERHELPEEKVQQVVGVIQESFLQVLEARKEDQMEEQDVVGAKQAEKEDFVTCSGNILDATKDCDKWTKE